MKKSSNSVTIGFNKLSLGVLLLGASLFTVAQAQALPETGKFLNKEEVTALGNELARDWTPVAQAQAPASMVKMLHLKGLPTTLGEEILFFKNKANNDWLSVRKGLRPALMIPALWVEETGTDLELFNKYDFISGLILVDAPVSEKDKGDILDRLKGLNTEELKDYIMNFLEQFLPGAGDKQAAESAAETIICGDHEEAVGHLKALNVLPVLKGTTKSGKLMEIFARPDKKKDNAYTVLMTEKAQSCNAGAGYGFQFKPGR